MATPRKTDTKNLGQTLRTESPRISGYILAALLVWLFSVLVFLPLAASVGQGTRTLTSIIIYAVLVGLLLKVIWGLKTVLDALAVFPARRFYRRRKTDPDTTYFLFRHACYLILALLIYLCSLPFLLSFHASIAGLLLIALLVWLIYVFLRAFPMISKIVLERIVDG